MSRCGRRKCQHLDTPDVARHSLPGNPDPSVIASLPSSSNVSCHTLPLSRHPAIAKPHFPSLPCLPLRTSFLPRTLGSLRTLSLRTLSPAFLSPCSFHDPPPPRPFCPLPSDHLLCTSGSCGRSPSLYPITLYPLITLFILSYPEDVLLLFPISPSCFASSPQAIPCAGHATVRLSL